MNKNNLLAEVYSFIARAYNDFDSHFQAMEYIKQIYPSLDLNLIYCILQGIDAYKDYNGI